LLGKYNYELALPDGKLSANLSFIGTWMFVSLCYRRGYVWVVETRKLPKLRSFLEYTIIVL
jgi:hypothetical protein